MKNIFKTTLAGSFIAILSSCSVSSETTYYKDASTSMQSNILMDKGVMGMMSMMGGNTMKQTNTMEKLSTEWKSLYDIQNDVTVRLHEDSAKVLKKVFMKVNKDQGETVGLSIKYDRLLPGERGRLVSKNQYLKRIPMQDIGRWDGKTLTIDTGKFNTASVLEGIEKMEDETVRAPQTKSDSMAAYGKQMAAGMAGMLRMMNVNVTNTLRFQKPIVSINGKHDFVKQIDNKTVQVSLRSRDLIDGTALRNKDAKIVIITE